ncbi:uncharacterized protein [Ptychodera flava]|uniref:uncharacterized protein n=1 Tax=Ptychodera flava TaxID=63121 RepID=UPI00396A7050
MTTCATTSSADAISLTSWSQSDEGDELDKLGCHFTWPELSDKDSKALERARNDLMKIVSRNEECNFTTLPSRSAALVNLQGFVAYSLKDDDAAIEKFEEVLRHDDQNHNALASLAFIYKEQGSLRLYGKYLKDLKKLHSRENQSNVSHTTIMARSLADRGHAIRFFEQDIRQFSYMDYFREAAQMGRRGDCCIPERAEWMFDYALALYRRDNHYIFAEASSSTLDQSFCEAAECLYEVTTIDAPSVRNRALAWVFLGILLNNVDGRLLFKVLPKVPDVETLTAEECFRRGLELSQGPYITRRVAAECIRMKQYGHAMEYFKKSLDMLQSWFAYRHQGRLFLTMYEDADYQHHTDKTELLLDAEKSFLKALEMKEVHADYSDLGYVYFLLGKYRKAVRFYKYAVHSKEDDFFSPLDTYNRWSRCLEAMGETEGATEKLREGKAVVKRVKELTIAAGDGDYHGDCCQGDCYKVSTKDIPGYVNLLKEYRVHARTAKRRTRRWSDRVILDPFSSRNTLNPSIKSRRLPFDFLVCFSNKDEEWALALLTKLEKDHGLKGIIHFRDFMPGAAIVDNIVTFIEKSHKTIVVLTPDFNSSRWCQYELKQAHCVSMESERDIIVPIMLMTSEVPKMIRDVTYLKCRHGQLSATDFDKLVQTLQQTPR